MSIEAMKQALEALSNTDTHPISSAEQYDKEMRAMEALEDAIDDAEEMQAIEQAEKDEKPTERLVDYEYDGVTK